jgi:AcrR family transcriptional regulator
VPTNRLVGRQSADYSSTAAGEQSYGRPVYGDVNVVIDATSSPPQTGGRVRILQAARLLFTAQGYASVSMQQIADAASVNKATLYHHFVDKEDLFVSVMVEEFARMATDMGEVIAGGGTLRDQLTRVASHVFASHRSDFGRLAADLHEYVDETRRADLMHRCSPPWEHIRVAIARALDANEVRDVDPELAARLFFAMVGSQIWWSKFRTDWPVPDDQLAVALTSILLDGIALPASNLPSPSEATTL